MHKNLIKNTFDFSQTVMHLKNSLIVNIMENLHALIYNLFHIISTCLKRRILYCLMSTANPYVYALCSCAHVTPINSHLFDQLVNVQQYILTNIHIYLYLHIDTYHMHLKN